MFFECPGEVELVGVPAPDRDLTDGGAGAAHHLCRLGQAHPDEKFLRRTAHVVLEQLAEIAAVEPAGVGHLLHSQVALIVLFHVVHRLLDVEVLELVPLGAQAGGGGAHQGVHEQIQITDQVEGGCAGVVGNVQHQVTDLLAARLVVRSVDGLGSGQSRIAQGLRGMQPVKFNPDILPGVGLVGKIGVDEARADQEPLPCPKLVPLGGHPVGLSGIQRALPGDHIVKQVVVADKGSKGLQGLALFIAVLVDAQIQKVFIGKDRKGKIAHPAPS